jgi:hypothetical protein
MRNRKKRNQVRNDRLQELARVFIDAATNGAPPELLIAHLSPSRRKILRRALDRTTKTS